MEKTRRKIKETYYPFSKIGLPERPLLSIQDYSNLLLENSQREVPGTEIYMSNSLIRKKFFVEFLLKKISDLGYDVIEFDDLDYNDYDIHQYNIDVLVAYFNLEKESKFKENPEFWYEKNCYLFKDFFIYNKQGLKVYLLTDNPNQELLKLFLEAIQYKLVKKIYSPTPLNVDLELYGGKKSISFLKQHDSCKDLSFMFNRQNYESWKKFNNKITQALNIDKKKDVELVDIATKESFLENESILKEILDFWHQEKLNDPTIHQYSLTSTRYLQGLKRLALKNRSTLYAKLIYVWWRPYWFISFAKNKEWNKAYELCFITKYKDDSFNINTTLLKTYILSLLLKDGVEFINSWLQLNTWLKHFKKSNWLWNEVRVTYMYSKTTSPIIETNKN